MHPRTCWLPCACESGGHQGLIRMGFNGSCEAFWIYYWLIYSMKCIITWGCCTEGSSWNRLPQPYDAVWTAACATPFSLTWRDAQSEARKISYWISPFLCKVPQKNKQPGVNAHTASEFVFTYHFNVVKDSRHLLDPFHHLLRVLCIFSLSRHLLIKRHLPAHSWVLYLKKSINYIKHQDYIL